MKKGKVFSIIGLCLSSVVTTLVTVYMAEKQITDEVKEHFESEEKENEEES